MRRTALFALVAAAIPTIASADLLAYWNFNSYDGDAHVINADAGAGVLTIDPDWSSDDLANFAGSDINALFGDPAGASLSLVNMANNGRYFDMAISTVGFSDLVFSFATRRTSTGFNANQIMVSADGGQNFENVGSPYDPPAAFDLVTVDLSSFASLNNNADVVVRIVLNGATSGSGNNRFDNIQFNGTIVPAPGALALLGLAGLVARRRRRA